MPSNQTKPNQKYIQMISHFKKKIFVKKKDKKKKKNFSHYQIKYIWKKKNQ